MSGTEKLRGTKVTIRNVAEDAGVSVAAVSKVIRNAYGVSDSLRSNVQASIDKLGYRPSAAARAMRGSTSTVGLLLVEMENPFLPKLIKAISNELARQKYKTMIAVGEAQLSIETTLIESMIDFQMDGVILVAPRLSGSLLEQYARQIPMCVIGHHEPTAVSFDTVNSDDVRGAKLAVNALIAAGHRDIHMVSLPPRDTAFDVYDQREIGYRQAMVQAGLEKHIQVHNAVEANNWDDVGVERILKERGNATAIFCWSDIHGVMLYHAANAAGLRVPEDLAIVSYDNSPHAAQPNVRLTTVDQDAARIGEMAARTLLSRKEGRGIAEHMLIEPHLVKRGSS